MVVESCGTEVLREVFRVGVKSRLVQVGQRAEFHASNSHLDLRRLPPTSSPSHDMAVSALGHHDDCNSLPIPTGRFLSQC